MTDSPEKAPGSPAEAPEGHSGGPDSPQAIPGPQNGDSGDSGTGPDSFPRAYVEDLRKESAGYRTKAQRVDALAQRLVTSMASVTGRLADASDLPYSDDLLGDDGLPDESKVREAIEDLLTRKPHLISRKPIASVDQGPTQTSSPVGLLAAMKASIM